MRSCNRRSQSVQPRQLGRKPRPRTAYSCRVVHVDRRYPFSRYWLHQKPPRPRRNSVLSQPRSFLGPLVWSLPDQRNSNFPQLPQSLRQAKTSPRVLRCLPWPSWLQHQECPVHSQKDCIRMIGLVGRSSRTPWQARWRGWRLSSLRPELLCRSWISPGRWWSRGCDWPFSGRWWGPAHLRSLW